MSDSAHSLASPTDWTTALEHSEEEPVLIFKHSSACSVSARAQSEIDDLAATDEAPPIYRVVVQEHRDVSNTIESDLGIRHETPQAILLHDRSPVFDTSHFDVTAATLQKALTRASVSTE